ncbi:hypothetical protein [Indioceanicola profundi]|uniref:hypothetical protein n=1 Tax=Indioceanicola profundi TaxID=2220096 RepID=UPI000E6AB87E|nr:hypothetical protein [Indioceanicola profundi]
MLRAILAETEPLPEPLPERRTAPALIAALLLLLVCGAAGWLVLNPGALAAILAFFKQQLGTIGG